MFDIKNTKKGLKDELAFSWEIIAYPEAEKLIALFEAWAHRKPIEGDNLIEWYQGIVLERLRNFLDLDIFNDL